MICDPCRGARHEVCASSVRPDGTERDIVAKTWCDCQHVLPPSSKCALDDCDEPQAWDGLCEGHLSERATVVDSDVSNEQHGTVNIPLTEYVKREDAGE